MPNPQPYPQPNQAAPQELVMRPKPLGSGGGGAPAPTAATTRTVNLVFAATVETQWGDTAVVVGSVPELGNWKPEAGLRMSTDEKTYPAWHVTVASASARQHDIEFKVVILRADGAVEWEPRNDNRRLPAVRTGESVNVVARWGAPSPPPGTEAPAPKPPPPPSPVSSLVVSPTPTMLSAMASPPKPPTAIAAGGVVANGMTSRNLEMPGSGDGGTGYAGGGEGARVLPLNGLPPSPFARAPPASRSFSINQPPYNGMAPSASNGCSGAFDASRAQALLSKTGGLMGAPPAFGAALTLCGHAAPRPRGDSTAQGCAAATQPTTTRDSSCRLPVVG